LKIYLTRHGETDFNLERRYQGQLDIPLNTTGRRQAELLARRLSQIKIDIVVSSDLSRTLDTARAVQTMLPNSPKLVADRRWRELSFGDWEGKNHEEIKAQWNDEAQVWFSDIVH
jgi:probable phosphoglycerate mutase